MFGARVWPEVVLAGRLLSRPPGLALDLNGVVKSLAVDSALASLMAFDLRKGRIFELRHFGGLSVDEAAEVLNVSAATVARDWRMAKAWLRRAIASEQQRAR